MMVISQLQAILEIIKNEVGDVPILLNFDVDQIDYNQFGPQKDELKCVEIGDKNDFVILSNKFKYIANINGFKCEACYDPKEDNYKGIVTPNEYIEGFDLKFTCKTKYQIQDVFLQTVAEYSDFLSNAKVTKTVKNVEEILNDEKSDLDYGDIDNDSENDTSSTDDDYGEE